MKYNKKKSCFTSIITFAIFLFSLISTGSSFIPKAEELNNLIVDKPTINKGTVQISLTNNVVKADTVTIRIYDKASNSIKYLNQENLNNGKITFTAELSAGTYYGYARAASDFSSVSIADFIVSMADTDTGGNNSSGTNNGGTTGGLSQITVVNSDAASVISAINTAASNGKITVDVTNNKIVAKAVFDAFKGTGKTLTFKENGVEWSFYGKDIISSTKSIDMTVKVAPINTTETKNKTSIAEKANNENVLVITFASNGQLPGKAKVRIKLDSQWLAGKNRESLNIYYFNETTKALEAVAKDLKIDAEGCIEFTITHNSDYIVSDKDLTKSIDELSIVRLGGANRYETSVKVSQAGWSNAHNVVLARGDNFADALCAAPLAKQLNAPILLTAPNALDNSVKEEIKRLKAKKVYIIGGTGAVSSAVENSVKSMGITLERISGRDRYETSLAIANKMSNKKQVFLATGLNFADTLSISSYAAATGSPILLTAKDQMTAGVAKFIKDNKSKLYVIGGAGVIADAVVKSVAGAERIAGADRYATNLAVLNKFAAGFDLSKLYLATGSNYPDAVCGAALAGKQKAPIMLLGSNIAIEQKQYISRIMTELKQPIILGGASVVSDNAVKELLQVK